MKTLLLLLSLLSHVISYGQGKVKRDITAKGDTVYSTPEKKIYAMPGARNAIGEIVKSSIYKSKTGFSLCLTIQTGRTSVFTISEGDAAEFFWRMAAPLTCAPPGTKAPAEARWIMAATCLHFIALTAAPCNNFVRRTLKR